MTHEEAIERQIKNGSGFSATSIYEDLLKESDQRKDMREPTAQEKYAQVIHDQAMGEFRKAIDKLGLLKDVEDSLTAIDKTLVACNPAGTDADVWTSMMRTRIVLLMIKQMFAEGKLPRPLCFGY